MFNNMISDSDEKSVVLVVIGKHQKDILFSKSMKAYEWKFLREKDL